MLSRQKCIRFSMTRKFTVLGEPVGKARPRYTRTGHAYTPKKTRDYEDMVRTCYKAKYGNAEPYEGPVRVFITAYFKISKSLPKSRRKALMESLTHCMKRPDIDNIAKIILDALNGLAYKDDKQVVTVVAEKFYAGFGGPCVEVEIEGVEK